MFWSIFLSKNKKLVRRWKKEHKKIVILANKVIDSYTKRDLKATQKALVALNDVAIEHLMTEDIEFYRTLKDKKKVNEDMEQLINEFTLSFKDTKHVLRDFLLTYTKDDAALDSRFFETFKSIVEALSKRITFEEENLYKVLASK